MRTRMTALHPTDPRRQDQDRVVADAVRRKVLFRLRGSISAHAADCQNAERRQPRAEKSGRDDWDRDEDDDAEYWANQGRWQQKLAAEAVRHYCWARSASINSFSPHWAGVDLSFADVCTCGFAGIVLHPLRLSRGGSTSRKVDREFLLDVYRWNRKHYVLIESRGRC